MIDAGFAKMLSMCGIEVMHVPTSNVVKIAQYFDAVEEYMTWTHVAEGVPWEDGWYLVLVELVESGRTVPRVSKWRNGWIDDNELERVIKWRQLPEH